MTRNPDFSRALQVEAKLVFQWRLGAFGIAPPGFPGAKAELELTVMQESISKQGVCTDSEDWFCQQPSLP